MFRKEKRHWYFDALFCVRESVRFFTEKNHVTSYKICVLIPIFIAKETALELSICPTIRLLVSGRVHCFQMS